MVEVATHYPKDDKIVITDDNDNVIRIIKLNK